MRDKLLKVVLCTCLLITLFAFGTMAQKGDRTVPKQQRTIALGEQEVKQLLLLMDTDKNGKISKKEFMDFMEAEFDRLDTDKSGELDVKELKQSQVRASRPAVGK
jgi:Ca2+-binding EF-hand superfamily protein